jgi:allantoin racemase
MTTICVITPVVTESYRNAAELQVMAPEGCEITVMTLAYGPASVESCVDEVLAGPGVVDAACRAQSNGCDAVVIDCMLDPALEAAREAVTIPVIGAGESGLMAAAVFGAFSVVTVLQRQESAFQRLARQYGLSAKLVSVRGINVPVLELERGRETSIIATVRESKTAKSTDGAQAIVFGCTGMLGYDHPTSQALGWSKNRVIDPLMNAIETAFAAVMANGSTDKGKHPFPERKKVLGFGNWKDLDELMREQ